MSLFGARTISKLAFAPPAPRPDRDGLAIAVVVRNEARFVAEWAAFHRSAGVRHFVLYDNGSTDGTVEVLARTLPADALTVVPWVQKLYDGRGGAEIHNQVLAFAHAIANFGPAFRWMAFIDTDEFIVPRRGDRIPDVLDELGEAAHLSLPWHMFGRCGHNQPPAGGVLENYLQRMANPSRARYALNWKCIVDPARVTAVRVHGMEVDGKAEGVNDCGVFAPHSRRADPSFYSNERLQLNHYYTRSDADLKAKIARGSNKTVAVRRHLRRVMRIVDEIEAETVEDRAALDYWRQFGRRCQ